MPALAPLWIAGAAVLIAAALRRDLGIPAAIGSVVIFTLVATAAALAGQHAAQLTTLVIACAAIIETDRRHHLIPDALVLAIICLAMAESAPLWPRALGAALLGGLFLSVRCAGSLQRRAEVLGLGDVKLAAAIGLLLGVQLGLIAVATAGVATLAVLALRSRADGAPFGIGLAGAASALALITGLQP